MHYRCLWTCAVLLAAASLIAGASPSAAADVAVEAGIVYAERGELKLELDLARPAEDGAMRPAVVCIHGGGWAGGHRRAYSGLIRELASRGYVAVTVTYRFSQVAPWPAQLDDVRDAVRWLRRNAAKYGVDPQRIGATGASAGGHLSLMLGLLPDGKKGENTRVQAVVNYFGPTDMRTDVFRDDVDRMLDALAGGTRAEKTPVFADLSPITHVSRGDSPILTFHGTNDLLVPVDQARQLHRALEEAKVPHRLEILEERGHGWGGEDLARTTRDGLEFFDAHLKPSPHPLLAAEDFDGDAERWTPTDAAAWKMVKDDAGRTFYSLFQQSKYEPAVRSPINISLLEGVAAGDFTLDVSLQSTGRVYGHQDLCIFFGHRDPSHFYYVHLGRQADPHANSIFLVDGKPRVSIAEERTSGTDWSEGWHRARVRRETGSGRIEVFFDDMTKPAMFAVDKTFLEGRIGLGSFDDTGNFDSVRVWGVSAESKASQAPAGE